MSLNIPIPWFVMAAALALMIVPMYSLFYLFRWTTRQRKSPLNIDLLRSPGQSLREEISDLTVDIIGHMLLIPLIALLIYSYDITYLLYVKNVPSVFLIYFSVIGVLGFSTYSLIKTYRMFKRRNVLRVGHECEVAVGQNLTSLLHHGFKVYHDFPADNFNIDHIAVGPTGVYAIETKGRAKQVNVEKNNWKLTFDGESLRFPGWTEKKPIQQTRLQAKWLSNWIESATGEQQNVVPVLAIPGWYITRAKRSDLRVYNGKGSGFLAKGPQVLSEKRLAAISHQIENECRNVKPDSYKKN